MAATSQKRSGTTDLTVGKPLFQILRFALPLVLGTLFQQLYSFADTVIVGRCLGTDALGAVGTTYSLNFLILGFVQGACVGFGIPVAETFGAKDKGGLRKYLFNGALLCVVLSVVFTLFTTLMAGPLLQLIHTPEELYADAVLYIRIIFLGIPATVLYNYASSVLRAMGDSQHPFYFLLAASVLNANVDVITLREPDSLKELQSMGVTKPEILLTADPALTLPAASEDEIDSVLLRAGIPTHGKYLCFALRNWKGFEDKAPLFAQAAKYAYETYGLTPVFAAVEKHLDPVAGRLAAAGLDIPHYFLDDAGSAGTIIGALSRMQAVVSMRLHALIFAAGQGIPLAGVVYDPKVSAFLRYIGQENFLDLDALTADALEAMIDRMVSSPISPEEQAAAVQKLRQIEQVNVDTARRLLGK